MKTIPTNCVGNPDGQLSTIRMVRRLSPRVKELLADRHGEFPIWIRAPKIGTEFYTGLSRAKLYEGAANGRFRSVSIREPGQTKGTRLFHLRSILDYVEHCESEAAKGGTK